MFHDLLPGYAATKALIALRFIAASWKKPQDVNSSFKEELRQSYTKALEVLLSHLPSRFHPLIQQCLDSMESILSLPMIISHWDLNALNFLVGPTTCHLTGIIDWVDSEICSFGKHLDDLYNLTGTMHTKNGWRNYDDQGSGVLHGNHHE